MAAEVQARTAAAIGTPDASTIKAHAGRLAEQIDDPESREVVLERLARQPWFGLAETAMLIIRALAM